MNEFSKLIVEAKAGEPGALTLLYERYAGPVIGAIRRRLAHPLRQKFDTMDLSQSVFAEVLRDLPRFRDQGEVAFRRWLYLKAETKIGSKLRKHLGRAGCRLERPLDAGRPPPAPGGSPASQAAAEEEAARVQGLVSSLDEDHRKIVLLRLEEELPFADIADRLGLPSPEAARKRYARSIARLRSAWRR